MAKKKIILSKYEEIIAVVPKHTQWAKPLTIHIYDKQADKYRTRCLQFEEQNSYIHLLFSVLGEAQAAMLASLEPMIARKSK